jgi:hypothetical protein
MFSQQIRPLIEEKLNVPMTCEHLTNAGFSPFARDWDFGPWFSDLDGGFK